MTKTNFVRVATIVVACASSACSSSNRGNGGGEVPGLSGSAGTAGLAGTSGAAGAAGIGTGVAGAIAGAAGVAGAAGAAGIAGAAGVAGAAGAAPPIAGAAGMDVAGMDLPAAGMEPIAGAAGTPDQTPPTPRAGDTCLLPGNGNYSSPGPYAVGTMDIDLGMVDAGQGTGMYTIFYPMPLETACLHPIVAWGNGTGVTGSTTYAFLNDNAASWGMVVAAAHDSNTGSGNFHKAGLDWLLAQNQDPGSMFFEKLSTRAGVSGHSQGGIGASLGAAHPNVETAAIEGMSMVASAKVSVLVLTGTMDIISGVEARVPGAPGSMFVANWEGGDHFLTETLGGFIAGDPGSLQFQRLYAAWFRCFLADDQVACGLFEGGTPDSCGICGDPGWHALASNF